MDRGRRSGFADVLSPIRGSEQHSTTSARSLYRHNHCLSSAACSHGGEHDRRSYHFGTYEDREHE